MARKPAPETPLVHRLPITKARINLGALVKRVHTHKEYVILEKSGIPIVGLMDIDEFEDYLELQHPRVKRHIAASAKEYAEGKSRPAADFFDELDEQARALSNRRKRRHAV